VTVSLVLKAAEGENGVDRRPARATRCNDPGGKPRAPDASGQSNAQAIAREARRIGTVAERRSVRRGEPAVRQSRSAGGSRDGRPAPAAASTSSRAARRACISPRVSTWVLSGTVLAA
jgi:hypothetical protein